MSGFRTRRTSSSSGRRGRVVQRGARSCGNVMTFPWLLYCLPLLTHIKKHGEARLHNISSICVSPCRVSHKSSGMTPGSAKFWVEKWWMPLCKNVRAESKMITTLTSREHLSHCKPCMRMPWKCSWQVEHSWSFVCANWRRSKKSWIAVSWCAGRQWGNAGTACSESTRVDWKTVEDARSVFWHLLRYQACLCRLAHSVSLDVRPQMDWYCLHKSYDTV